MQKLLTPLQYEPVLESLNSLRPLQVKEQISTHIELGVLDRLSVDNNKSAEGMLAKCTGQGDELIHNAESLTGVETRLYPWPDGFGLINMNWSQKVYFVVIDVYARTGTPSFNWRDPYGVLTIKALSALGVYMCEFVGTNMYLHLTTAPVTTLSYNAYGFYK